MQAGKLREAITLLEPVLNAEHEASGFEEHPARAEIRPASNKEMAEASQMNSYLSHRCWIRYLPGITTAWKARWGGRTLQIQGVVPDQKRRWIELKLSELDPVS